MSFEETVASVCRLAGHCGNAVTRTQGAGGNVSFLLDDTLWVKRSGLRLRDMRGIADFVPLPAGAVRELLDAPDADARLEGLAPPGKGAPSVESFFHAQLGPVTAHLHWLGALVLAADENAPQRLQAWAGTPLFAARVGYFPPGAALGRAVRAVLPRPRPTAGALLLQNHGAVFWGPSATFVQGLLERVESGFVRKLQEQGRPLEPPIAYVGAFSPGGVEIALPDAHANACRTALARPLTPDAALHMGFGLDARGGSIPALGRLESVDTHTLRYICDGPETLQNALEIFAGQCLAFLWAFPSTPPCLTDDDITRLLLWGAGKYKAAP